MGFLSRLSFYHRVLLFQGMLLAFVAAFEVAICVGVPLTLATYLSEYQNTKFGVFGLCQENVCHIEPLGYSRLQNASFDLPSSARISISYLLVMHPIAAGMAGVQLAFCCVLFTRTLCSAGWILNAALFWTLPTFAVFLLTFLVDLILFSPYLSWCGWMSLVMTVLVAVVGSFTCLLNRTATSRDEEEVDNIIYLHDWEDQSTQFTAESYLTDMASSFRDYDDDEIGSSAVDMFCDE